MTARAPSIAGFTLLELSISTAVLAILALGIFGVASGSAEMIEELRLLQDREARRSRLIELCRENFEGLPPGARIEFAHRDRGSHYDGHLSLVDAPGAFGFGAAPSDVKRVVLATEPEPGGLLRAVLYHLDAGEDSVYRRQGLEALRLRPVTLVRGLRAMTWRFFRGGEPQWRESQEETDEAPVLAELTLAFAGDPEPVRTVFWVPLRRLPEPPAPQP